MKSLIIRAAKEAGKVILKNYDNIGELKFKAPRSIVTKVDLMADKVIIKTIKQRFPDHNFITEETGVIKKNSEYTWIVDPIDGTTNFVSKIPNFAVSIALAKNNEVLMGVVYNPCTNEMFFAEKGKGSYLNDKRLKVSKKNKLKDSMLGFSTPSEIVAARNILSILSKNYGTFRGLRNTGSAAINLCYIAAMKTDLYFTLDINSWDAAAAVLIVEEAGGKVTNSKGKKWSINDRKIIASNGILHKKFMKLLNT